MLFAKCLMSRLPALSWRSSKLPSQVSNGSSATIESLLPKSVSACNLRPWHFSSQNAEWTWDMTQHDTATFWLCRRIRSSRWIWITQQDAPRCKIWHIAWNYRSLFSGWLICGGNVSSELRVSLSAALPQLARICANRRAFLLANWCNGCNGMIEYWSTEGSILEDSLEKWDEWNWIDDYMGMLVSPGSTSAPLKVQLANSSLGSEKGLQPVPLAGGFFHRNLGPRDQGTLKSTTEGKNRFTIYITCQVWSPYFSITVASLR